MELAENIEQVVTDIMPDVIDFLSNLVSFDSTSGKEHGAMKYLYDKFSGLDADIEKVPLGDSIKNDTDYSSPITGISYDGRFNLRVCKKGSGGGKKLLFNTHVDVVPPSEGMQEPWKARIENGTLFGRGACDAKGQVAAIYAVYKMLEKLNITPAGDVIAHLVVEEENGGNGTLAMARRSEAADGCVVLEPSDGKIYTSIRGAIWFRILFFGKAGHSGEAKQTKSALLMAHRAIGLLEAYHAELLKKSRGFEFFDDHPNPMPITFGRLEAGNWPASAPNKAVMEGVLGLLPNKTKEDVCREFERVLMGDDTFDDKNCEITFTYRHDCSVVDKSHLLPSLLFDAAKKCGEERTFGAMTASCDAWFYNNILGIPTIVYGPGKLKFAHAINENIELDEISRAAKTLTAFALNFCEAGS